MNYSATTHMKHMTLPEQLYFQFDKYNKAFVSG